ncbi:hypothetical protein T265_08799 [Opisthorchis viverrini]|uniref:Uncharacterized protein n=1 Tax=Opisthorchis viverrini TaxID=6198 RepID=A0A074ZCG1_OPIVI|nr:hypothetical protein T265_08799 [Opisthorchis viverrini]KER23287.1 hypothetical protein T265_08799 [Opisthorchis viverrini]
MLKALQNRSIRPLSASAFPSHSLFLKHFTCPSIPRDLNPTVSVELPHTVPSPVHVDCIIANDCPTQPVSFVHGAPLPALPPKRCLGTHNAGDFAEEDSKDAAL